jgi:multiple sugar transport system permease protein
MSALEADRAPSAPERLFWRLAVVVVAVYALLPVLWLLSLSLKPGSALADGRLFPRSVSLEHYRAVLSDPQFPAALGNSLGIGFISTLISVTIATLAAYAIVRLRFPGRRLILAGALAVAMFPPIAIVGPLFDLWRQLGLFDAWTGLIVPYVALTLPLALWTISAFFREIPWELEEAARVDGASRLGALRHAILPLALPGVFASAILVFIFVWNDFLFAISLTSTTNSRTVPAAIAFFTGSSRFEQPTGSIAAASILVTVPIMVPIMLLQRRIVAGLTAGAVKG